MVSRRGKGRRAAARSDGARHGDARRAAVGAHRPESRREPRRVRVLHELQQPQSRRARREPAGRDRLSLARARAPAARRRASREIVAPRLGAIFSNTPAREPPERVGVSAERTHYRPIVSRRGICARANALWRSKDSVSAVLGRLSDCRKLYRVLAGTAASSTRSSALSKKRKHMDDFQAWTIENRCTSHVRVSNSVWAVVINR